jgi:hypothetical protein
MGIVYEETAYSEWLQTPDSIFLFVKKKELKKV